MHPLRFVPALLLSLAVATPAAATVTVLSGFRTVSADWECGPESDMASITAPTPLGPPVTDVDIGRLVSGVGDPSAFANASASATASSVSFDAEAFTGDTFFTCLGGGGNGLHASVDMQIRFETSAAADAVFTAFLTQFLDVNQTTGSVFLRDDAGTVLASIVGPTPFGAFIPLVLDPGIYELDIALNSMMEPGMNLFDESQGIQGFGSVNFTFVPEPSAAALLALGLVSIARGRRRARR